MCLPSLCPGSASVRGSVGEEYRVRAFFLCFVPLFVAVDAIGVLPLLVGLTEGIVRERQKRIVVQSVLTAGTTAALFVLGGEAALRWIGISMTDFTIAGGALLFAISLRDLLDVDRSRQRVDPATVGAVPIGVPLITGPAVLTTCVLLVSQHGTTLTLAAALANVAVAGLVFWFADPISRQLGSPGTKTLSKMASLLLAAIGVMMVRRGVTQLIAELHR